MALVCPPISGHLNPTLALASELQRRGHQVALFGLVDAEPHVRAAGIEFIAIAAEELPRGTVASRMQVQGQLAGARAMRWILRCLLEEGLAHLRCLPDALRHWQPTAVLVDQVLHGATSAAQLAELPYLTLCNALPVHADPHVPPFATPWDHRTDLWGRFRNTLGLFLFFPLLRSYLQPLNRARHERGLPALSPWDMGESRIAMISQMPAVLEFPDRVMPDSFHFTGPWIRAGVRERIPFPFERLDGRPLVYASMGTLQNRILPVFHGIADACSGLEVQLVMALGARDASIPDGFPGDPIVVPMAPQLELLKRASLTITHAGLNTALETLMFGVPMVTLPVANDQPGVAARVRHHGAGELIPIRQLTRDRLRGAIGKVLQDPSYRQAARRLQSEMANLDGVCLASDIVEESLGRYLDSATR